MKKYLLLLTLPLLILAFASCEDNGKGEEVPYENEADASKWFFKGTVEVTQTDNSKFNKKDLIVKLVFNEERNVCNMVMYDAQFASAMPLFDITVSRIMSTPSGTGYYMEGNNIIPTYGNGSPMEIYKITGLKIWVDTKGMEMTMMCGTFPLTYSALAYQAGEDEFGDQGEDFTDPTPEPINPPSDAIYSGIFTIDGRTGEVEDEIKIGLTFDDSGMCKMVLYNATFTPGLPPGAGMPRMDIEIDGISCAIDEEGIYILTGDGIIPVAGGTEVTDFPVTDLKGTITDDRLTFSMTCGTTPAGYVGQVSEPETGE